MAESQGHSHALFVVWNDRFGQNRNARLPVLQRFGDGKRAVLYRPEGQPQTSRADMANGPIPGPGRRFSGFELRHVRQDQGQVAPQSFEHQQPVHVRFGRGSHAASCFPYARFGWSKLHLCRQGPGAHFSGVIYALVDLQDKGLLKLSTGVIRDSWRWKNAWLWRYARSWMKNPARPFRRLWARPAGSPDGR